MPVLEYRAAVGVDRVNRVVLRNDIDYVVSAVVDLDILNQQWLGIHLVIERDGLQQTEACLADRLRRQNSLVTVPTGAADVVVISDDLCTLVIVMVAAVMVPSVAAMIAIGTRVAVCTAVLFPTAIVRVRIRR
jgi:hypothetical protein